MAKGYKFTKEQKERLSKAHLGQKAWNKGRGSTQKNCGTCDIEFTVIAARRETSKFCSRKCANVFFRSDEFKKLMKKVSDKNPNAFEKGQKSRNKGVKATWIQGEKNPRWKGGITPENIKIRQSFEMKQWREAVFTRDDYICQHCEERGGKLHAHHIKFFSTHPELRTDITNGLTLCVDCHKKVHAYAE